MSTLAPAALGERLLDDVHQITVSVARTLADRFPSVAGPPDVDGGSGILRPTVHLLLHFVVGAAPADRIEQGIRTQVQHHVRAAAPQQEVLDAHDLAMSLLIAQVWQRGRPGDHAQLTLFTQRAAEALDIVQRVVVDAYWTQAKADRFGRHERRLLAHGLLVGRATPELAEQAGQRLAERYRAVVLRNADHGGAWRDRASEVLHERGIPHCVLPQEVVAFAPDIVGSPLEVGDRLGVGAVAAGAAAPEPVADLAVAVTSARLVACLALTVPLLDTVVSADQIRLELTLLNDEGLAESMRQLAAPISMREDLLHTIRVLYQMDLNRTSTARRLGVARRTLSGRLTRIQELTGLDPTSTRGIQVLYTALTAMSMHDALRAAPGA